MDINFWNYKNEYEVDFVFKKDNSLYGFEVKSFLNKPNLTTSMKRFIDLYSVKEFYVFNENIKYNECNILFTNYMNVFSTLNKIND